MKTNHFIKGLVWAAAMFTLGILLFIIGLIVWNGFSSMNLSLFEWEYTTKNVSMMPAIISTLVVVGVSLLIAAPIGVFTGFYLVEYADRSSKFLPIIRLATDTLAAVPSMV